MKKAISIVAVSLVLLASLQPVYAQRGSRGSVSGASRGSYSRSGNTASWQGGGGYAKGSGSATRTSSGGTASHQTQTQSGASRDVSRSVDQDNQSVDRSSTTTNAQGETASRERTTEAQGGYATVEGSAKTSTGRSAEGQGVAGRTVTGQPVAAGSVDTKYHGSYAGARGNPYGAGGAYTRGYTYRGVPYHYPVPVPYYTYYEQPPVGAMIIMVAGVSYLMSQDGSYSKKTTDSQGKAAYQSVPAPEGAQLNTLPAQRALVTVSGTIYYLYSNTFYRRVVQGTQEQFVVVSPPAGVVFIQALPADFEVVQLNTMYFASGGHYYVPYLSADGQELYVLVDTPPTPQTVAPAQTAAPALAPQPEGPAPAPEPAPAIQTVAATLTVPTGTLVLVRLQADINLETAKQGDRFQAFLDQDLAADGRLIVAKGARAYGVVIEVEQGRQMKGSVALTDIQVGGKAVSIKTQPLHVQGQESSGGTAIPAHKLEAFTVAVPFQIQVMTNVAVR